MLMASLTKFSFILREVRTVVNLRLNQCHVNRLCTHSTAVVEFKKVASYDVNKCGLLSPLKTLPVYHSTIFTGHKYFDEKKIVSPNESKTDESKKKSLFQRFKEMYRDYWYVLVPVHVVTSAVWFGGFYYAAKSGIDIVAFVEKLHLSDAIVDKIRSSGHSTAGYIAISYALYKIFTPLRYTVTLGGTTISINYLTKWGYIKPIPKKEELKKMISEQRSSLREKRLAFKDRMLGKLNQKKKRSKNILQKYDKKE
ncbi:uncharacterized protein C18orf19 homolog B-like isoform X2 [Rhodnius prolixus]|uniref:uncharacterized protein C18orf19 homolog B-like isoform X2 n=1 Tax=Rhodnius prolixus TaxID=13249 RepID=UPI003D18B9E0